MRAALVVRTCGPGAGVAGYAYNIATRLALKLDLTVCALRLSMPEDAKPSFAFREVKALGNNLWTHLATFGRGVKKTLPENLDVVHSQGGEAALGDVVTMHFCYRSYQTRRIGEFSSGASRIFKRFNPLTYMHRRIERLQVAPAGAKKIICVSQGLMREFLSVYEIEKERIIAIPNGVDLERFNPARREAARAEIIKKHNLQELDFIVIFTGFDFGRKGLDILIRAIGLMREKNAKLLVVGGNDEDGIYSRIAADSSVADKVKIIGPAFDIEKYYAASDCFCMPSKYEAFSLATLEAAASGIPIIATRVNGTDEIIAPGETGYFVECDSADIAARLDSLASDRPLRGEMGAAARRAAENFSWDRVADETLKIYREAAAMKEGRK